MNKNDSTMNRRDFIRRSIKAGAAIAFTGTASYILYDTAGPGVRTDGKILKLPDYRVSPVPGKYMAVVKGKNRHDSLNQAIDLLGGISRFIKRGDRVVIKPNIAFATSPALGATSHPEIVSALIKLCFAAGAAEVSIMDNPINDPAGCYLLSGIKEVVKKTRARLVYPDKSQFSIVSLEGGTLIKNWPVFDRPLVKATKLIGLAPVKSHQRSGASMSMKNWYGLLGGRRNIFHQDINTIIAELAMMVKPTLVILDAFDVMMTNGPTGGSLSDLKRTNTVIAATDQVAADSYGASLLGLGIEDLPYLLKAEKAGAGTTDFNSLKPFFYGTG